MEAGSFWDGGVFWYYNDIIKIKVHLKNTISPQLLAQQLVFFLFDSCNAINPLPISLLGTRHHEVPNPPGSVTEF